MNEKQITKEQILNIFNEICEKISPDKIILDISW